MTAITSELTRGLDATITSTISVLAAPKTARRTLRHQDSVIHACEAQTSMIRPVAPDLVRHERLRDAHGAAPGLTTEPAGLIYTPRSFPDRTPSGVAGDARTASATDGEAFLTVYAQAIADALPDDQPTAAGDSAQRASGHRTPSSAAPSAQR